MAQFDRFEVVQLERQRVPRDDEQRLAAIVFSAMDNGTGKRTAGAKILEGLIGPCDGAGRHDADRSIIRTSELPRTTMNIPFVVAGELHSEPRRTFLQVGQLGEDVAARASCGHLAGFVQRRDQSADLGVGMAGDAGPDDLSDLAARPALGARAYRDRLCEQAV